MGSEKSRSRSIGHKMLCFAFAVLLVCPSGAIAATSWPSAGALQVTADMDPAASWDFYYTDIVPGWMAATDQVLGMKGPYYWSSPVHHDMASSSDSANSYDTDASNFDAGASLLGTAPVGIAILTVDKDIPTDIGVNIGGLGGSTAGSVNVGGVVCDGASLAGRYDYVTPFFCYNGQRGGGTEVVSALASPSGTSPEHQASWWITMEYTPATATWSVVVRGLFEIPSSGGSSARSKYFQSWTFTKAGSSVPVVTGNSRSDHQVRVVSWSDGKTRAPVAAAWPLKWSAIRHHLYTSGTTRDPDAIAALTESWDAYKVLSTMGDVAPGDDQESVEASSSAPLPTAGMGTWIDWLKGYLSKVTSPVTDFLNNIFWWMDALKGWGV